jgi:hypothetical protein
MPEMEAAGARFWECEMRGGGRKMQPGYKKGGGFFMRTAAVRLYKQQQHIDGRGLNRPQQPACEESSSGLRPHAK